MKNLNKGTVVRAVLLIAAIVNQTVAVLGGGSVIYKILSVAVTAVVAVINAWENNDWTFFARLGTGVLDALRDGKITADEVRELLDRAGHDRE